MFHVEHMKMKAKYCLFIFWVALAGCKKPTPDPQAGDVIYQSFKAELASVEARLTEKEGELNDFKNQIAQTDIESSELKVLRAKANFATHEVRKLQQGVKYWKLKLLSREEVVRTNYLAAFNRGEEWNNAEELEKFHKANERLSRRQARGSKSHGTAEAKKPSSQGEAEE
jgi:hypothetical protein